MLKKITLGVAWLTISVVSTAQKKYKPAWESLKQYEVPDWFRDAKFGIYYHWGPYSVPAYKNEWYSRWMYVPGNDIHNHHIATYGTLDTFGYKDFISLFKAEKFNADEWADLFVKAGARFAGPVVEHSDGFAMWDSKITKWDAKDMGPKRDLVGAMEKAVKERGLKFIATYHRHWMYAWYPTWDESVDAGKPEYSGLYGPKVPKGTFVMANKPTNPLPDKKFNKEWLQRIEEVVKKYEPDLVWFDNKMDIIDETYRRRFLSCYYNLADKLGKEVVVTYKFEDLMKGTAVLDVERSRMSETKDFPWLTDDSIDWGSWSDVKNPNYKSANRLIDVLVDIVSKNGNLLLNITPKANGEIPREVKDRLLEMGQWLQVNGEAIYGTRPWKIYGEGGTKVVEGHLSEEKNKDNTAEDIRFTTKGDTLYAMVLDWPGNSLLIRSLGRNAGLLQRKITSIQMLGDNKNLPFEVQNEGLRITMPENKIGNHAFAFRILSNE